MHVPLTSIRELDEPFWFGAGSTPRRAWASTLNGDDNWVGSLQDLATMVSTQTVGISIQSTTCSPLFKLLPRYPDLLRAECGVVLHLGHDRGSACDITAIQAVRFGEL